MYIDNLPLVLLQRFCAHLAQVASQNNQVGLVALQGLKDSFIQGVGFWMGLGAQMIPGYSFTLSSLESLRPTVIADDDTGAGAQLAIVTGIEDGLHVTP
jgi:hypothetical protein